MLKSRYQHGDPPGLIHRVAFVPVAFMLLQDFKFKDLENAHSPPETERAAVTRPSRRRLARRNQIIETSLALHRDTASGFLSNSNLLRSSREMTLGTVMITQIAQRPQKGVPGSVRHGTIENKI